MSTLNLNKYANLAEYYADTRPVGEHNVSYIGNEYVIYDDEEMYDMQGNKIINWQNYLNFYMPNGGTISLNKIGSPTVVELEYWLDDNHRWIIWQPDNDGNRSITLTAGQRMYVRNTSETKTGFSTSSNNYYKFDFIGSVEAHGNMNSLLCRNSENVQSLPIYSYYSAFLSCTSLVTAPELPATTIGIAAYAHMFRYCSSLVTAPELPATTLSNSCYYGMFYDCSSLQELRTMMTDVTARDCLDNWLSGVAAQGDFYCPAELTISEGVNGIPSGWTRHDI